MGDSEPTVTRLVALPELPQHGHPVGVPCKRPTCGRLAERDKNGRPTDFCSGPGKCQTTYQAERKRAKRQLQEAIQVARIYEWEIPVIEVESAAQARKSTRVSQPYNDATATSQASSTSQGAPRDPVLDPTHGVSQTYEAPAAARTSLKTTLSDNEGEQPLTLGGVSRLLHEISLAVGTLGIAAREDTDPSESAKRVARVIERLEQARTRAYEELAEGDL